MRLPFTHQEFFDLLAAYNAAWWPAVVLLWGASVAAVAALWLSPGRSCDRWMNALLAALWAWGAVAYHAALFTRINPAAWLFAALFIVQAALLARSGLVRGNLSFTSSRTSWSRFGAILIVYALAYPLINAAQHGSFTRIPTYGLPCPTTILTAGLLLRGRSRSRSLSVIPIVWSVIGGSAAFLFGIAADYALLVAGAALLAFAVGRKPL